MKLSEVVDYLNLLESQELDPTNDLVTDRLENIATVVKDYPLQFGSVTDTLTQDLDKIKKAISEFNSTIQTLKQNIQDEIKRQQPTYYQESYRLYEQDMVFETNEHILNRKLKIDFDSDNALRSSLRRYGDWRLSGMIIRPAKEDFIEEMVPLDPLYLVDNNMELLMPAISAFTPEYQRRLRPYTINEYENLEILGNLPSRQFGLIFAYNYFNFKPIQVIERFLIEIYQKLRPGGVVIFTYNECDRVQGIGAAENNWMCYTPGTRIRSIAEKIGYEVLANVIGEKDMAWFELRVRGPIISLRGGQTIAKILPK